MNAVILVLATVFKTSIASGSILPISNFTNVMPWAKYFPEAEYMNRIEVRLVPKSWLPDGVFLPSGGGVLDQYAGSVPEAFAVFMNASLYQYTARPLASASELLTSQFGYNPQLESIVIIHTISGDAENYFVKNVIAALAMRNFIENYNIFALNMPGLTLSMEQSIGRSIYGMATNYETFASAVGTFFNDAIQKNLMTADKINIIGFCYSSQLAGYIGRDITKHNNGQKIKSILGLDPYSFGLSSLRHQVVSASDAQTVHLYHTNSMVFGTFYRRGTADFIFNDGHIQPGCLFNTNFMCSHRRSVLLLWYIILYPERFMARQCYSAEFHRLCLCFRKPVIQMTYPLNTSAKGKYFLATLAHRPYGYGPKGANCFDNRATKADKAEKDTKVVDFSKSRVF